MMRFGIIAKDFSDDYTDLSETAFPESQTNNEEEHNT